VAQRALAKARSSVEIADELKTVSVLCFLRASPCAERTLIIGGGSRNVACDGEPVDLRGLHATSFVCSWSASHWAFHSLDENKTLLFNSPVSLEVLNRYFA
jgi:hypothetical protein